VTSEPAEVRPPRRRLLPIALGAILVLVAAALLAIALSPALRWTVLAHVHPAQIERAFAHVPSGRPVVAAVDARRLLGARVSSGAARKGLETLAASRGVDLAVASRFGDAAVLVSDGTTLLAVAVGVPMSPFLLKWQPVDLAGRPAARRGDDVLVPLEPGVVAWTRAVGGADAMLAQALDEATTNPQAPLDLSGDTCVRLVADMTPALRAQVEAGVPHDLRRFVRTVVHVEATLAATDHATLHLAILHENPDAAAEVASRLEMLDMANRSGMLSAIAPLLGGQADLLSNVPPFDVERKGPLVDITAVLDEDQLAAILEAMAKPPRNP
jgi:hypothetical protein